MAAFLELKSFLWLMMNAHMSFMWENAGRCNYGGEPHGNYGWPGNAGTTNAALAPGTKDDRPPGWIPEHAHIVPLRKYIQQLELWQYMTKVEEGRHGIAIFRGCTASS